MKRPVGILFTFLPFHSGLFTIQSISLHIHIQYDPTDIQHTQHIHILYTLRIHSEYTEYTRCLQLTHRQEAGTDATEDVMGTIQGKLNELKDAVLAGASARPRKVLREKIGRFLETFIRFRVAGSHSGSAAEIFARRQERIH